MTQWISFHRDGVTSFGRLADANIHVHAGDLFGAKYDTGEVVALQDVKLALPCRPGKFIGLWNNFAEAAAKQGLARPAEPLFFLKSANSFRASGDTIAIPEEAGRVLYEGELGVVIGRAGRDIPRQRAAEHIFGYTCVNDVTAIEILRADATFPQWTRAKGLDGFGPFGPVIATGLDSSALTVRTLVNGRERQAYPVADMFFSPVDLVTLLSRGLTLEPGDVIACGTSNGAGPIPRGATVEVAIDGVGVLRNQFA
jgi:2-keto-4-pentenoate hydratase/2-oxohepta-3-ene-1,7-dioic acid hydratase in catechol pathway